MKKIITILAGLFLATSALAVQITVPSAPGAGYGLVSLPSGNYVASSTIFGRGAVGGLNAIQVDDGSGAFTGDQNFTYDGSQVRMNVPENVYTGINSAADDAAIAIYNDSGSGYEKTFGFEPYASTLAGAGAKMLMGQGTRPAFMDFQSFLSMGTDNNRDFVWTTDGGTSGFHEQMRILDTGQVLFGRSTDYDGQKVQVGGGMSATSEWIGNNAWSTIGALYPIANGIVYDQDQGGNGIVTPMFVGADFGSYSSNPLGVLFRNDVNNNTTGFSATDIGVSGANLALQPEGGPVFIGSYAPDGSGATLQVNGSENISNQLTLGTNGTVINQSGSNFNQFVVNTGAPANMFIIDNLDTTAFAQVRVSTGYLGGDGSFYFHQIASGFNGGTPSGLVYPSAAYINTDGIDTNGMVFNTEASAPIRFGTNSTLALIIDVDQSATFSANVIAPQVVQAGGGGAHGLLINYNTGFPQGYGNGNGTIFNAMYVGSNDSYVISNDTISNLVGGDFGPYTYFSKASETGITFYGTSGGDGYASDAYKASIDSMGGLFIAGAFMDSTHATGTSGQILSSTGTSTKWIAPSGGGGAWYQDETPSGTVNGTNHVFSLAHSPSAIVFIYVNGKYEVSGGVDYTRSGTTITFATSSVPQTGDIISANYQ